MGTLATMAKEQVMPRNDLLMHPGAAFGARITMEARSDGRIEVRAAGRQGRLSDLFGTLKCEGGPLLTIEQISEVAAAGWACER